MKFLSVSVLNRLLKIHAIGILDTNASVDGFLLGFLFASIQFLLLFSEFFFHNSMQFMKYAHNSFRPFIYEIVEVLPAKTIVMPIQ